MKKDKLIVLFFVAISLYSNSCMDTEKEMSVLTGTAINVTSTTADITGNIIDLGNGADHYGHCFSTGVNPTISATKNEMNNPVTGEFTSNITGLIPNTKYYVRAFLQNSSNVVYGDVITFTTGKTPPSASVADATLVSSTTATLNGSLNPNGYSTTAEFEYGITNSYGTNITAAPSPVTGSSLININAAVIGLNSGTLYHFRVKAVNEGGTTYSNDLTFSTLCTAPFATTNPVTYLENTSVTFNGSANANGCITNVVFDYGLTASYGQTLTAVQSPLNGTSSTNVSVEVSGLISGQTYHYRIKAINGAETFYGGDIAFTTKVNDNDGNAYNMITIGTQVWMKDNLKTSKLSDGSSIPHVTDPTNWISLTTPGYCWWNNIGINEYGALYNWYAVNTGKLCPSGWHVPSDAEWSTLINYLDPSSNPGNFPGPESSIAGGKLKETGTIHWGSPNTGATNESGFTAFGGGYRSQVDGHFGAAATNGYYQTGTEVAAPSNWNRGLNSSNAYITRGTSGKGDGLSVRCIRN